MKQIKEAVENKELFKKNFARLKKSTYPINNIEGMPSFTNRWQLIHADALLALVKYFKKKYKLKGSNERMKSFSDQVSSEKNVRASSVYSSYRIIRKAVLYSKFKNPARPARVFQYGNKFFPLDREDLHLLAVNLIEQKKLLGPVNVVNLTGATQDDFGNVLGNKDRTDRVFRFLGVPPGGNPNSNPSKTDGSGKKLTQKQLDLFNKEPDKGSLDIGFKTPAETDASIKALSGLSDKAHKVRAALLMIRRAEGALKNAKDPEKKKNLQQSLRKWMKYKDQIVEK